MKKALILCLLLFCNQQGIGQDEAVSRISLKGIKKFKVQVDITSNAEKAVLGRNRVVQLVDEKLKAVGAKRQEDPLDILDDPLLWVRVEVVGDTAGLSIFAVYMSVQVVQAVVTQRDPSIRCIGTTWGSGTTAIAGSDSLKRLESAVTNLLDQFVAAYMSVNPAPQRNQQ